MSISDSVLGSIIGVGGSLFNSAMNVGASAYASGKSYKRAVQLWNMQKDWQEYMSNTAHQREVKDLRAAGLNPILSATGGNGASSGTLSAPTNQTFQPDIDESAISSALSIRQQKNQNKLTESQNDLATQQAKTERWKALSEQQNYDDVVPLQMEQIKANILNQNNVSAAQVRNLDANSQAALINATSNATSANVAHKNYLLNQEVQSYMRDKEKRYKQFGEHHPYLRNIDETLQRYTSGFGFSAAATKKLK